MAQRIGLWGVYAIKTTFARTKMGFAFGKLALRLNVKSKDIDFRKNNLARMKNPRLPFTMLYLARSTSESSCAKPPRRLGSTEGHFASECRNPKENKADSEDGDEQPNDTTCLMAIDSQENFIKTFEKLLKEKRALEDKNSKLLSKINDLEIEVKKLDNKEVVEPCLKYVELTQEVDSLTSNVSKLQDEALNFSKFKSSSIALDDMLSRQKLSHR
ncbi:hypothetical protein Tco_0329292 [Tanacetum coccineum]